MLSPPTRALRLVVPSMLLVALLLGVGCCSATDTAAGCCGCCGAAAAGEAAASSLPAARLMMVL